MTTKNVFSFIYFILACITLNAQEPVIIRGPYLNMVSSSSVVIRWRTDKQAGQTLFLAREGKKLRKKSKNTSPVTDHEISLSGLQPATKYYYSIGSAGKHGSVKDSSLYFRTAPEAGSTQPVRIWALGDFGNGSQNQLGCLHAIDEATRDYRPDAWIWLGDNAYDYGKDEEYQQNVFKVYGKSYLQNTALYPSPGNHDYRDKRENGKDIAYYSIFTLPEKAETGGVASGTEAYYSVNYGNVHLVSLNSEEEINENFTVADTSSAQLQWLKKDLAANQQTWTVIYLHRPPYTTSGSHNSDKEDDLVKMRENLVPLLERYRVDLVLAGHSHVYERTFPIREHYGMSDTFDPARHIIADNPGSQKRGIVYIVNGAGGQIDSEEKGTPLPAAAYYNNSVGGSMLLDFSGNRLDARWVCADGITRDQFSIIK